MMAGVLQVTGRSTCQGKLNRGSLAILHRQHEVLAGGLILHLQGLQAGVQPLQHVSLAGQPACQPTSLLRLLTVQH